MPSYKVLDYDVLFSKTRKGLRIKVKKKLKDVQEGAIWQPQGGVVVKDSIYLQAMVKTR